MSKTAVIVGASGGIGSVIAQEYATNGYSVIGTYNENKSNVPQKDGITALQIDVSNPASVKQAFSQIDELDVMIFCVANEIPLSVEEATYEQWRAVTAPMIDGAYLCTHYAASKLKNSDNPNIIYIPSTDGIRPDGTYLAYQVSESALIALTKGNAKHLAKTYKIRVNAVCPGPVRTGLWDKVGENSDAMWSKFAAENSMGRVAEPVDVARACMSLTEDPGKYLNGNFLFVNGEGEF